jgi:Ca2+-binding EF-hand superfamily protein
VEEVDANGDGEIDIEEFVGMMARIYATSENGSIR